MKVTTIGFVAKLTPSISDVDLMHPIFVVSEFMILFLLPAIKCKPVEANVHDEECEVSGRDENMRNYAIVFLEFLNEIATLLGGHSPYWLGEPR